MKEVSQDEDFMEELSQNEEFIQAKEEWHKNYEKVQKEVEKKAEQNVPKWIREGQALIFPQRHDEWEKYVVESTKSLYHGYEIECALEIMQALENDVSMEEVKQIFIDQKHSGLSAAVVRNIVFLFSSKGPEFCEATIYGEISPENKQLIEAKRQENIELNQINEQELGSQKL